MGVVIDWVVIKHTVIELAVREIPAGFESFMDCLSVFHHAFTFREVFFAKVTTEIAFLTLMFTVFSLIIDVFTCFRVFP